MKKILFLIILFAFLMNSCQKETPIVSDRTAPEIIFTISTTGWTHTFKSNDLVGGIWELRLKPGTIYNYTITSTDEASGLRNLNYNLTRGTGGYWRFNCTGAPEPIRENHTPAFFNYTLDAQLYKSYIMRGSFQTGNNMNNSRNFQINITSRDNSNPINSSQINIPVVVPFETPGLEYGWIRIFG